MSDFLNFADMGKVTVIYIYQHTHAHNKIFKFSSWLKFEIRRLILNFNHIYRN